MCTYMLEVVLRSYHVSGCALGCSLQELHLIDRADSKAHLMALGYAIGVVVCTGRQSLLSVGAAPATFFPPSSPALPAS